MKAGNKAVDVIRLALWNVVSHKMRSGLTMLSILFGVWSVIAMLAINEGASRESERALRELGSNNIIIESVEPQQEATKATTETRGPKNYGLTRLDVRRLRDNLPGVLRSVGSHRRTMSARVAHRGANVTVIATEPVYARVGRLDMLAGRFISHADYLRNRPYCVITSLLARRLFACDDPLGQPLKLGMLSEPFIVIGVLRRLPRAMTGGGGIDRDNCVVIPLSTDRSQFGEVTVVISQGSYQLKRVEVSQYIFQMKDEQAVIDGARIVKSMLKRYHEGKDDFKVVVPLELLKQQAKQRRLWNYMFVAIALISLLVGGIGIANIMLASVTERTREIGVRRAMGAKRRDITVQFLVEAVTLTTAGGLLGIAVGMLIPFAIRKISDSELPAESTPFMLFLPFVVSVAVGLISGLWPALRAARLDPIDALRHE